MAKFTAQQLNTFVIRAKKAEFDMGGWLPNTLLDTALGDIAAPLPDMAFAKVLDGIFAGTTTFEQKDEFTDDSTLPSDPPNPTLDEFFGRPKGAALPGSVSVRLARLDEANVAYRGGNFRVEIGANGTARMVLDALQEWALLAEQKDITIIKPAPAVVPPTMQHKTADPLPAYDPNVPLEERASQIRKGTYGAKSKKAGQPRIEFVEGQRVVGYIGMDQVGLVRQLMNDTLQNWNAAADGVTFDVPLTIVMENITSGTQTFPVPKRIIVHRE